MFYFFVVDGYWYRYLSERLFFGGYVDRVLEFIVVYIIILLCVL